MKILTLSAVAVLALSTFAVAGGDIEPVVAPIEEVTAEEVTAPVSTDSGLYVGGGISWLSFDLKGTDPSPGIMFPLNLDAEASWTGGTFLAGYQVNKYLAVEGRYTRSYGDASWEDHGSDDGEDESELSNLAIYVKPMYPIDNFSLYALLGYGKTTFDIDGIQEHNENGFQWGIGASYGMTDQFSVFVDYTQLYNDEGFDGIPTYLDIESDSITLGVTYKF